MHGVLTSKSLMASSSVTGIAMTQIKRTNVARMPSGA